jgi:hypothetical protein
LCNKILSTKFRKLKIKSNLYIMIQKITTLFVGVLLSISGLFSQNTSRVQFIHNVADFFVPSIDIWIDDSLALSGLDFRTASAFLDLEANQNMDLTIQPAGSTDTLNAPYRVSKNFDNDSTYIVVARGIFNAGFYNPAPAFGFDFYPLAREIASIATNTDILFVHGSTDAPAIDAYIDGTPLPFITNAVYRDFEGYFQIPTSDFIINITATGNTTPLRRYLADLDNLNLQGEAVTILASGFLNTAANPGSPFGLWLAKASGGALIQLNQPPYTGPTARAQIIHNSADQAIASIDVWINDTKQFPNFNFRTATPFFDIPANTPVDITIQPINSLDTSNAAFKTTLNLDSTESYIIVANGIVSFTGYTPDTALTLDVYNAAREFALLGGNTDVLVHHGSTDAPAVDLYVQGNLIPFSLNLNYRNFDGYFAIPTSDIVIDVKQFGTSNIIQSYEASFDLLNLDSAAVTILASGFLNPSQNSNGAGFGLWMARATGGNLIPLPIQGAPPNMSKVQIIHNSPDAALSAIDIWLDDSLAFSNVNFRTATPFIDLLSNLDVDISFQTQGALDTTNALFKNTYNFNANQDYVLVANGIVSVTGYNPNIPFSVDVYANARIDALDTAKIDVLFHHGSTDAPNVNVALQGLSTFPFVSNAAYTNFQGYSDFANSDFIFELIETSSGNILANYEANFLSLGLQSKAITVLASGFTNPANNSNGADFGLWAALPTGGNLFPLPEVIPPPVFTRLQIIHNAADLAASVVSIWIDDSLAFPNVAFRNASPFFDIIAETDVDISILPVGAIDTTNALYRVTYNLDENLKYILVANGIISATGYNPNIPFDLYEFQSAREVANVATQTDILVFHGATDAPSVDVYVQGNVNPLFSNVSYSNFAGYIGVNTNDVVLDLTPAGNSTVLNSYSAELSTLGLQGEAITILASGFLNPANNSNGAGFGLWAARAIGGALIELPIYVPPPVLARVQIIHNSADLAASPVDIWIQDSLAFANVAFRTATPFFDFVAASPIDISIVPAGSPDTTNAVFKQTVNFDQNSTYIVVANGIISNSGYSPSPNFGFHVFPLGRETGNNNNSTAVLTYHGATDAPIVNVTAQGIAQAFANNISYSQFQGYRNIITNNIVLNVIPDGSTVPLASYAANLLTLGLNGKAITVLASGFLDPSNNSNGADFGLWAALPTGGALVELPEVSSPIPTGKAQIINNSADVALSNVDVWVGNIKIASNLSFRNATSFVNLDVSTPIEISFTPTGSTNTNTYYHKEIITLLSNQNYVLVLHGFFTQNVYNPAPFVGLHKYQGARENALNVNETDVLFYHGSSDLFEVDFSVQGMANPLFTNVSYGEFDGYAPLASNDVVMHVYPTGSIYPFSSFRAKLATDNLAGKAITILASGFYNPANNANGPNLTYWYAKPTGGALTQFDFETNVENTSFVNSFEIYPNPAKNLLNINYNLVEKGSMNLNIYDLTGKLVLSNTLNQNTAGENLLQLDLSNFSNGLYVLQLTNGKESVSKKLNVVRWVNK